MLGSERTSASRDRDEAVSTQRDFYAHHVDPEFEITRPHSCGRLYAFLIAHKIARGLETLGQPLRDRTVLDVCCGSGMLSEALVRRGALVTGIDDSDAAIARARERARRQGFAARFVVGDATALPFARNAFDVVCVHDGLHHLDDPAVALREMARVARRGVLVMEPAEATVTRLAMQIGFAQAVEDAGNPVRRLDPQRVAGTLRVAGFPHVRWCRSLMYYPHQPYPWFRWFDRALPFAGFRAVFWLTDVAFGRFGNKLALAARVDP